MADTFNKRPEQSAEKLLKTLVFSKQQTRYPGKAFLLTPVFAAFFLVFLSGTIDGLRTDSANVLANFDANWGQMARYFLSALMLIAMFFFFFVFPLYRLFRRLRIESALVTTLMGGLVAGLFYALPDLIPAYEGSKSSVYAQGCLISVDGIRTACGWEMFRRGLSIYIATGLLSGIVFWRLYAGRWVMKI